tara:strand:+ start:103 stop:411 length:309 start_codon:yes stop_codon:yes gene_type:complete
MEENLTNIENICGTKPDTQELIEISSDPNFVFVNDPDFQTLRLFDVEGNVINVNSWIECANYVNGGWTNSFNNFSGDTFLIVITIGITFSYFISKKFLSGRN